MSLSTETVGVRAKTPRGTIEFNNRPQWKSWECGDAVRGGVVDAPDVAQPLSFAGANRECPPHLRVRSRRTCPKIKKADPTGMSR